MKNRRQASRFTKTLSDSSRGILIISVLFAPLRGQEMQNGKRQQVFSPSKTLPSAIQSQVQALGARMRIAGKEETVLDAQFMDDVGNKKAIRVVHQIDGMVRIEGLHEKSALTFDGLFPRGTSDRTGDALLDAFVSDTTEGLFYSLQKGASMVLLGHDFQLDSQSASELNPVRYDIYVVTAPDRLRRAHLLQVRRFYFDSKTGLLASTRYSDLEGINIETRFSNWKYVDGSAYPMTIERYENGRLTFSINATRLTGQAPRNIESLGKGVDSLE